MKSVLGSCGLMATHPCELVHDAITCFPQQMMRWKSRLLVQNVLLSFVVFTTQSTPTKCALAMDRALKGLLPSSNPVLTATLPSSTLVAATMSSARVARRIFAFVVARPTSRALLCANAKHATVPIFTIAISHSGCWAGSYCCPCGSFCLRWWALCFSSLSFIYCCACAARLLAALPPNFSSLVSVRALFCERFLQPCATAPGALATRATFNRLTPQTTPESSTPSA